METIDRAEEYRRLKDLYAQKSDDELQLLAADCADLTDIARQAIGAEIARRGLEIKIQEAGATPGLEAGSADGFDPSNLELEGADRVWDISEARKKKSILDEAGIPSFLGPDNLENVDDFKSSFEGGVDLKVRSVDLQRAFRALSESTPLDREADKDYVAHCPKCHSTEIVFQGLDQAEGSGSDSKFNWTCDACGHRWNDDGIEE